MSLLKRTARRIAKRMIIQSGLEAVAWSGATRVFPAAAGRGLIFTLHHVRPADSEPFQPNALLAITPEFLAQAIETCLRRGLTPVPLEALPALLADRNDSRKFFCFTLDDGYRDNAEFAQPVFDRYGIPFTVFITAGFVERTRTMWWQTAERLTRAASSLEFDFGNGPERVSTETLMQKFDAFERFANFVATIDENEAVEKIDQLATIHGVDASAIADRLAMDEAELQRLVTDPLATLGAHTVNHLNLKRVEPARLEEEMGASAAAVERFVGKRPSAFCYPYGSKAAVGEREHAAAIRAGFAVAVTTQPGTLSERNLAAPTSLPRVSLNGLYQKARYVEALISGIPFKVM